MTAKLQSIKAELRRRMHEPIALVGEWLKRVILGYYQSHAIPGNLDRLNVFRRRLRQLWAHVIRRRSQRSRNLAEAHRWTPTPRVLHPYSMERFAATIQNRSRMR